MYCGNYDKKGGVVFSNVVKNLMTGPLDVGRPVFTDNYYIIVSLAHLLFERKPHLVGTVRSNRKLNAKDVSKN